MLHVGPDENLHAKMKSWQYGNHENPACHKYSFKVSFSKLGKILRSGLLQLSWCLQLLKCLNRKVVSFAF